MAQTSLNIGRILDTLSEKSKRPRYAFMVLNLLAEQAGPGNRAGPFVTGDNGETMPLREWIGDRLSRMSGRDKRRQALEKRIRASLKDKLPDDLIEAQQLVDSAVADHVRATGADNASRVFAELERCGYLTRFYQGRFTNHENRGGLRNLVCVLDGDAIAALRRRDMLI
ncbi:hypothetical protein HT136_17615 [Novosphingobium profundi]|uniref:hypothetical protein n=1 Tax=Novosphingobium profundi TaxID=1774954 RepID=UPI001BD9B669|nr:hypothetical protein [Novosphingobium profundi]MBT0670188.1 hypothetical protein [Novosphingobium profundi]